MEALEMALTNKQVGFLHVMIKQNGIQDAEYRDLLEEAAGVSSSIDLDNEGLDSVLELMELLGYEVNRAEPSPQFGDRPGMASQKQIDFIYGLSRGVFGENNETAFQHWLENKFHVSHLRFLDQATASKAIEGLKSMKNNNRDYSRASKGQVLNPAR